MFPLLAFVTDKHPYQIIRPRRRGDWMGEAAFLGRRKRLGGDKATRDNSSIRRERVHLALARRPGALSGSE